MQPCLYCGKPVLQCLRRVLVRENTRTEIQANARQHNEKSEWTGRIVLAAADPDYAARLHMKHVECGTPAQQHADHSQLRHIQC